MGVGVRVCHCQRLVWRSTSPRHLQCSRPQPTLPHARHRQRRWSRSSRLPPWQAAVEGQPVHTPLSERLLAGALAIGTSCLLVLNPALSAYALPATHDVATLTAEKVEELAAALNVPPKVAEQLVSRYPELSQQDPKVLGGRARAFTALLQLPASEAWEVVLQAPRALLMDPAMLREHLKQLSELLAIPESQAIELARHRPTVLLPKPSMLREHLARIEEELHLTPDRARSMAASSPGLLLLPPELLSTRLDGLGALLDESHPTCLMLVRQAPRLLLASTGSLKARLQELQRVFRLPDGLARSWALAQPQLLTIKVSAALGPVTKALQDTFQISTEVATGMVRRSPALLLEPFSTARASWSARWQAVAQLLAVDKARAQELIVGEPVLLTYPPEMLREKFDLIGDMFQLPEAKVRELLLAQPSIIARDRAQLLQLRHRLTSMMLDSAVREVDGSLRR